MGRKPSVIEHNKERLKLTRFTHFKGKTIEEIKTNIYSGIFIDDFDFLKENFDLFELLISLKKFDKFYARDYEILKFIEDNLNDYVDVILSLIDDYENKDRSYLNLKEFEKTKIEVPLNHLFWNAFVNEVQAISFFTNPLTLNPYNSNGYKEITIDNLKKIKEFINELASKYANFSDLEKTILVSNYLQNKVQFIAGNNISESVSGTYITDSKGRDISFLEVSTPECVLFNNYGICNGIALATEVLLNNDKMKVNVRTISGLGHAWNVIKINGKYYYIDNTWNITRNSNRYEESLKAKSFGDDYLLFANDDYDNIISHIPLSFSPLIADKSISKEKISRVRKKLSKVVDFDNYNEPVFESKLIQ